MRFYFDVKGAVPVRDHRGRDFPLISEAIGHAKAMAVQLRAKSERIRPGLRVCVIADNGTTIHEEMVFEPAPGLLDQPGV